MSTDRLYGNWLPAAQRFTLRGIGWKGVSLAVGAYFAAVLLAQYSLRVGVALVLTASVGILLAGVRIGGTSVAGHGVAVLQWRTAQRGGAIRHTAVTPHGWALPGPLAQTRMVDVHAGGGPYGAVHHPSSRRLAVTLRLASTAADLNDDAETDAAVSRWERFLEGLGRHPEVAAAVAVVETAPASGAELEASVLGSVCAEAPPDCAALMATVVAASPAVAARTETRLTLVFDLAAWGPQIPRSQRGKGIEAYLPLLDRSVTGLESALDGCGVTVLGRATAAQLAAAVRVAFDPAAAGRMELAATERPDDVPAWHLAGPATAVEYAEAYAHDSGLSASFVWTAAPRQFVPSTVLDALTRPGSFRKRVVSTYVPTLAQHAMTAASARQRGQRLTAAFSRMPVIGRARTAQDEQDSRAADQAAAEVALGAGWVAQTVSVTVTVLDEVDLPAAIAEVEQTAGRSQLRLRRMARNHAAGFLAGLPAGLDLHELTRRWAR
ncbi:SCO6880 family protein [Kineosporia sp. A_224]|uniref:SCO6880 family protein n=1 Tax=Kineosporia sp. A_224 TaxID=1962180 RepID=UPI000B4A790E|nr:SCO6880 family protein [Kineosporia sp. A_224]